MTLQSAVEEIEAADEGEQLSYYNLAKKKIRCYAINVDATREG